MNKKIKSLCILLFFVALSDTTIAQYFGGVGKGEISDTSSLSNFSAQLADIPYLGGNGRGDISDTSSLIFFSTLSSDIPYLGGNSRGDINDISSLVYFSSQSFYIPYLGGNGRGDICDTSNFTYFNSQSSLITFTGGIGRGDSCSGTDILCLNPAILNLKLFIEGFYTGGGLMQAVLYNNYPSNYFSDACDSITVELHNSFSPYALVASVKVLLLTDGGSIAKFPFSLKNDSYYIAILHRNSIETWSKNPVLCNCSVMNFDFTK